MYETLTRFLPELKQTNAGEWVIDRENDESQEHPIHLPYVSYGKAVRDLEKAIGSFVQEHEEMKLTRYGDILAAEGLQWDFESMSNADVSAAGGRTVMALLVGAVRAERFCDGALLDFCQKGCIVRWLERLKEIDEGNN